MKEAEMGRTQNGGKLRWSRMYAEVGEAEMESHAELGRLEKLGGEEGGGVE